MIPHAGIPVSYMYIFLVLHCHLNYILLIKHSPSFHEGGFKDHTQHYQML